MQTPLLFLQPGKALVSLGQPVSFKKQRNTPDGWKRNQDVNHSADHRRGTTEEPCDHVDLENSNKAPVYAAYDQQRQCQSIQHILYLIWYKLQTPEMRIAFLYVLWRINEKLYIYTAI